MNEDFSVGVVRHGEKLKPGEERRSLAESGLTPEQQEKWREATERLGIPEPEVAYAALPKIEKMAEEMYSKLPEGALVVFSSTKIPRAKFTADLLANEITHRALSGNKHVRTAFFWEEGMSGSFPVNYPEAMEKNRAFLAKMQALDANADESLKQWAATGTGSTAHDKEDEIVFGAFNEDMASDDSFLRKRAAQMGERIDHFKEVFKNETGPVYVVGIGHHSNLIALDVLVNHRNHYDSVDEIPKPLELWKVEGWPPGPFGEPLKER